MSRAARMHDEAIARLTEALEDAGTPAAMAALAAEEAQRQIGYSALSFVQVSGRFLSREDTHFINGRCTSEQAFEKMSSLLPAIDREVIPFSSTPTLAQRSIDLAEVMPPAAMRRSVVFNEFWRPLAVERQLIGFFGSPEQAGSFLCVARSAREAPFTAADLQRFDRIRAALDAAAVRSRARGLGALEDALEAVTRGASEATLVFEASGRLLWLTDVARSWLRVETVRIGSTHAVLRPEALAELTAAVRRAARSRLPSTTFRSSFSGEELFLRRIELSSGRLLVVASRTSGSCAADVPGRLPDPARRARELARRFHLSRRQAQVLAEVVQGKTNKVIAATLGCAEVTVEIHVTALLAKLTCKNRVELTATFWTA